MNTLIQIDASINHAAEVFMALPPHLQIMFTFAVTLIAVPAHFLRKIL